MHARVSEWSLSTLPSPIPELQPAPLPLKGLWARERASTPSSSAAIWAHIWVLWGVGGASFNVSLKLKITKEEKIGVHSLTRNTSEVEGHVGAPGWGPRQMTRGSIIHTDLHKPNNKLINAWLGNFWCTNEPRAYTDSQISPQPELGGSHHLPPYSD